MLLQLFIVLLVDNIAVFFGQVALILQKTSYKSNTTQKFNSFRWTVGLILIIFSNIIHVAVLPYADLVLLTSSSATAIIFGIILSVLVLYEKFTVKQDLPAVILIVIGCITTVTFANKI